jgi:hypothetical protein
MATAPRLRLPSYTEQLVCASLVVAVILTVMVLRARW